VFLRRRVPRLVGSINARTSALRGTLGGARGGGRRRTPVRDAAIDRSRSIDPVGLARAALGWAALSLFAVAGVARPARSSAPSCCGRRTPPTPSRAGSSPVPRERQGAASLGFSVVAAIFLWLGLNLLGDLIEGKAHQRRRGPARLRWAHAVHPRAGLLRQGATWVYTAVATHVGPSSRAWCRR